MLKHQLEGCLEKSKSGHLFQVIIIEMEKRCQVQDT